MQQVRMCIALTFENDFEDVGILKNEQNQENISHSVYFVNINKSIVRRHAFNSGVFNGMRMRTVKPLHGSIQSGA